MNPLLEFDGEDVTVELGVVGPALQVEVPAERLGHLLEKARLLDVLLGPVFSGIEGALVRPSERKPPVWRRERFRSGSRRAHRRP